jgi:lipopolysaccharide transport system permease protein
VLTEKAQIPHTQLIEMEIARLSRLRSAITVPRIVVRETSALIRNLRACRRILRALTIIECRRKYAGSILGILWYPLYSALLLASYCFVYLVVFRVRYSEFGTYEFVLFVFAGLIPYLGFSEAVGTGLGSVKANLALLRNSVFPIEFVPVKHVLAALVGLVSSLAILLLMIAPTRYLGWHLFYLPVPLASLLLFTIAVVWILSAIAVVVPDVAQVVNIALLLFMFVSPIGFSLDMVPAQARLLVYLNPMTYLIEAFRFALLGIRVSPVWADGVFLLVSLAFAAIAGVFFRQMSPIFSDYE